MSFTIGYGIDGSQTGDRNRPKTVRWNRKANINKFSRTNHMVNSENLLHWFYLTILLILSGCQNTPLNQVSMRDDQVSIKEEWNIPEDLTVRIIPAEGDPVRYTASEMISIIQSQWSDKSVSVLRKSSIPEKTKYTTLFFFAFRQVVETDDCEDLELLSVRLFDGEKPLGQQGSDTASKPPVEIWEVNVCGRKETHYMGVNGKVKIMGAGN